MESTNTTITLYWRPGCPFCMALRAKLKPKNLPLHEVNIWDDPEAAARVHSVADGNETVPTVFVGEHAMVNPSAKEVMAAVAEHAPDLLSAEAQRGGLSRLLRRS